VRTFRRAPAVLLAWMLLVPLALVVPAGSALAAASTSPKAADYVVVLKDDATLGADQYLSGKGRKLGIVAHQRYRYAVHGFAARLTAAQLGAVRADPAVRFVAPDTAAELTAQTIPTGIARVGTPLAPAARIDGLDGEGQRVDVDVAIIDTGIQADHPDLNVVGGHNCTTANPNAWGDGYGHGTHVAGTVGALDNGFGVVGVAPGARLWAVRVFDSTASTKLSWIVCGIDWVAGQRDPLDPNRPLIEVANMSLRDAGRDDGNCGLTNHDPEHYALCNAVLGGTTFVVSAGNDATSAGYWRPASYNEPITVSALADFDGKPGGLAASTCSSYGQVDRDDTFADFSNYGADVDLIAPGKCILSTYKGSSYKVISGTSMASPTVAGGAALYKASHPDASPAEVKLALQAAGSEDWASWTDPDGRPERLLDVSSFGAPPDVSLRMQRGAVTKLWTGVTSATYPIRLVRGNGFADAVDLAVAGLPARATATFSRPTLTGLAQTTSLLTVSGPDSVAPGTYPITITASGPTIPTDGSGHVLAASLVVDHDATPPTVAVPAVAIRTGIRLGASPGIVVTWSGSDAGVGLSTFELQHSIDGGAWRGIALPAPGATSVVRSVAFGHSVRYRVRATDLGGNVSAWMTGASTKLAGYRESSQLVRYSAGWHVRYSTVAWGGRTRYTTRLHAAATFTFIGREVALVAPRGRIRGKARVYADGVLVATVSEYRSTGLSRQVLYHRVFATYGRHTLRLVNLASSGHSTFEIDGFIVRR
jgi:subtilisin